MTGSTAITPRRAFAAFVAGLMWTLADLSLASSVMVRFMTLGDRTVESLSYRLVSWTALMPLTVANHSFALISAPAETPSAFAVALVCYAAAAVTCMALVAAAARPRGRRVAMIVAFVATLLAITGGVGLAVRDARAGEAQRAFFALLAGAPVAHKDAATVSAASRFVASYPDSRWVGEALRIIAMDAWDADRYFDAEALWRRFESTFADPTAPGVAYAELSRGLCDERAGARREAACRYRAAIAVIRARHDGIQAWIATSAAQHLAVLEQQAGMLVTAGYWKTKAQTFSDVYSIE